VESSKKKSKNKLGRKKETEKLKTLKIRLLPNNNEKEKLDLILEQSRWYYNATVNIFSNKILNDSKETPNINISHLSYPTIRSLVESKELKQEINEHLIFQSFEDKSLDIKKKSNLTPWWPDIHTRIPRGSISKFVSSYNSAVSNLYNKNISSFQMKYQSKKRKSQYASFEDSGFPSLLKKIKSRYTYKTSIKKRQTTSFENIFNSTKKRGCELIYDKIRNQYYIHYSVDVSYYPSNDIRTDRQGIIFQEDKRIISLDPGIRKFMTGYDPTGKTILIGDGEADVIINKLLEIDDLESKKDDNYKFLINKIWLDIKNKVNELHWKTIRYLLDNYDIILLPKFLISGMVRSKKIGRKTKRMLYMYSFFQFKQKLLWKASVENKKVIIVDESYTSKTCGCCGCLNDVGSSEIYKCKNCELVVDRDINGARNIFLKNYDLIFR